MSYTLLIEKTEVKHYRLDVELDYDDLVEWVDKFALGPSSYKEYLVEHLFDLTVSDTQEPDFTEEEYYMDYVEDYFQDQDPDVLFTRYYYDASHRAEYELESEDYTLLNVNKKTTGVK
jgi:hypothetical protein